MNPRIRELARQAGAVFEKTNGLNDFPQDSLVDYEIEKFARLIVEECLCKIELEAAQYHEPVWAAELINDIKDHFGV